MLLKLINKVKILLLIAAYLYFSQQLLFYIKNFSVNILFSDHWDFYNSFFSNLSLIDTFMWQHGPHRLGLGGILTRFIAYISHWNTYYESLGIGIVLFISSLLAFWLKYRIVKKIHLFDAFIPFIFMSLYQWETLVGVPNLALSSLPILFLILTCLLFTYEASTRTAFSLLILNFLTFYTGFGIFLTPFILFYFLLMGFKKKKKHFYFFFLIGGLSLLPFLVNYNVGQASGCLANQSLALRNYLQYIYLMITSVIYKGNWFGNLYSYLFLFYIVSSFLILLLAFQKKLFKNIYPIFTLYAFSLSYVVFTALGRICLGNTQGQSSRYVTFLIPLFFASYLFTYLVDLKLIKKFSLLLLSIFSLMLIKYQGLTLIHSTALYEQKKAWKDCYLIEENIEICDQNTNFKVYPNADAGDLTKKLDYLKKHQLNLYLR